MTPNLKLEPVTSAADDVRNRLKCRATVCPYIRNGFAAIECGADPEAIWMRVALELSHERDRLVELATRALENAQAPIIIKDGVRFEADKDG